MRAPGGVPDAEPMATGPRTLQLEILPGPGPVRGRLLPVSGAARSFEGWLQLLDVLAEAIDVEPDPPVGQQTA